MAEAIEKFVKDSVIPMYKGGEIPEEIREIFQNANQYAKECMYENGGETYDFYTEQDVRRTRNRLHGYVISPLDKNAGLLNVMCEKRWHMLYENTFDDNLLYKEVIMTEEEVVQGMLREYMNKGLDSIAIWNENGALPIAYILMKDKDLERIRPVIACADHPAKPALRVCAKGGTLMLKAAVHLKHLG